MVGDRFAGYHPLTIERSWGVIASAVVVPAVCWLALRRMVACPRSLARFAATAVVTAAVALGVSVWSRQPLEMVGDPSIDAASLPPSLELVGRLDGLGPSGFNQEIGVDVQRRLFAFRQRENGDAAIGLLEASLSRSGWSVADRYGETADGDSVSILTLDEVGYVEARLCEEPPCA